MKAMMQSGMTRPRRYGDGWVVGLKMSDMPNERTVAVESGAVRFIVCGRPV